MENLNFQKLPKMITKSKNVNPLRKILMTKFQENVEHGVKPIMLYDHLQKTHGNLFKTELDFNQKIEESGFKIMNVSQLPLNLKIKLLFFENREEEKEVGVFQDVLENIGLAISGVYGKGPKIIIRNRDIK